MCFDRYVEGRLIMWAFALEKAVLVDELYTAIIAIG